MELKYKTEIRAPKQKVWNTMMSKETYNSWAKGFSEHATFEGEYVEGQHILFVEPGKGGTKGLLKIVDEPNHMLVEHTAVLDSDSCEMAADDMAQKWIGSTEDYKLLEENGITTVNITMQTDVAFKQMFDESWPKALQLLKEVCEQ